MITTEKAAKTKTKHISCDFKCKFSSTTYNLNKKLNKETYKFECKKHRKCKRDYSWNSSACICENIKYLKSIVDTSVIACDKIISVMGIVSLKRTNTIARNVSMNCYIEIVRYKFDCHVIHAVLLAITLPLIITKRR